MKARFAEEGVSIAGVYYCPHHPEKGIGAYKQACDCRKPEPGMLLRAARELSLDPGCFCAPPASSRSILQRA